MATSSSQQTIQTQAFPCYTKRKLESDVSSVSLVYENGVFTPRSEKRQRFNGDFNDIQGNNFDQNNYSVLPNAEGQEFTKFNESRSEQNMKEDSEMMEETTYSNSVGEISAQTLNGEANLNGVLNETRTEITNKPVSNGVCHVNLPRTRTLNCTMPAVHSYCFQGGLLDNMLVNYHGL